MTAEPEWDDRSERRGALAREPTPSDTSHLPEDAPMTAEPEWDDRSERRGALAREPTPQRPTAEPEWDDRSVRRGARALEPTPQRQVALARVDTPPTGVMATLDA